MIPVAFDYVRARLGRRARSRCSAEHGDDAKLLAGGHSLLPMMKLRLAAPELLVDIGRIAELRYVAGRRRRGRDRRGHAAPRRWRLRRRCAAEVPLLRARRADASATRRCATAARSAARSRTPTRPPTCPPPCWRSTATVVLRGPAGRAAGAGDGASSPGCSRRRVEPGRAARRGPGAARPARAGWAYEKFTRRANDWAIVAVAVVDGRVALVNMGPTPLRASATEAALADGASIADAAALADQGTDPPASRRSPTSATSPSSARSAPPATRPRCT